MVRVKSSEVFFISVNVIVLAIFYTLFGALLSYILYYIFDEYTDDWKKKSIGFQLVDVGIELSVIATIAFWSSEIIKAFPPFLPVRKELDTLVDEYISGIFFIFAVFVFMDQLTDKLKFLFEKTLAPIFNNLFPKYGSIINLSLSYSPRKTDKSKFKEEEHQNGVSTYSNN